MKIRGISIYLLATLALITAHPGMASGGFPIAGLTPWQRPAGAPVIEWVQQRDQAWFEQALTGVSRPYPPSLNFLENQGNWYTPFTRKGMLPPYDLRGWHINK